MRKTKVVLASSGLLAAALIWGFAFVVVKDSLDTVPPVYMLAFRFIIASLALSAVFIKRLKGIKPKAIISGIILGVFVFAGYLLQTVGCKYTTAGKNAFLTAVYVIAVPFQHWIINGHRAKSAHIAAGVLAIAGIGLLSLQTGWSVNIGDLLTLLCGIAFGIHIVFVERYAKEHNPVVLTVLQLWTAALISCAAAPLIDGGVPVMALNLKTAGSMLYLGLLSTMGCYLLQNVGQKYVPPNAASILLSTEAIFGAFFSVAFLGERLTPRMLAGCVLIFAAILLSGNDYQKAESGLTPERGN